MNAEELWVIIDHRLGAERARGAIRRELGEEEVQLFVADSEVVITRTTFTRV